MLRVVRDSLPADRVAWWRSEESFSDVPPLSLFLRETADLEPENKTPNLCERD